LKEPNLNIASDDTSLILFIVMLLILKFIGNWLSLFNILSIYINGPFESLYSILFIVIDSPDEIYFIDNSIYAGLSRSIYFKFILSIIIYDVIPLIYIGFTYNTVTLVILKF
jgi:hypothetical protein